MAIETAISLCRPDHSNIASPRNAPNEVERVNISARQPVASAMNGSACLAYAAPPQALLVAVERQRVNLLNVLGTFWRAFALWTSRLLKIESSSASKSLAM